MRVRPWSLAVAVFLAGGAAAGPAVADVSWSGPGWYVEGTVTGMDTSLISGPYATEADCKAAQPADDKDYVYGCYYDTTDPTDDGF